MDARQVFEAIEQFKRDHPEYEQAGEIMGRCQEIIAEYQRIVDAQKPTYVTVTTPSTGIPPVGARGVWVQVSDISGSWLQFESRLVGAPREVK